VGARDSLSDLRLGLHNLRPDLLLLQEVQGRNERDYALHAQHESLAAALDMEACYGCNAIRTQTDHGNALLSRFSILDFENEDISDHMLEQRGLLHATIDINGTPVHCIVVHLGLFAGGRSRQVNALVTRIKRLVPDDAPLIIGGDFNDWTNRLAPLFVEQLGLYEVFALSPKGLDDSHLELRESVRRFGQSLLGKTSQAAVSSRIQQLGVGGLARATPPPRTFPSAFPWLRLDRIYQRGFAVRSAKVLQGQPWRQLSDHAPILTELELP